MKELLREWKKYLREQAADPVELPSEPVPSASPREDGQTSTATQSVRDLASLIRVNWKAINYVLRKFLLSKGDSLPFHVRGYIEYLSGRTAPFTERDMQPEQYDELKKYMYDLVHGNFVSLFRGKSSNLSDLLNYLDKLGKFSAKTGNFEFDKSLLKMPYLLGATANGYGEELENSITDRLSQPIAGQLSTFLGQYVVTNNGTEAVISDQYDFNSSNEGVKNLVKLEQQYGILDILEELFLPVITAMPDLELGSSGGFREVLYIVANILTTSGYKGYPINIKLRFPINKNLINKNIEYGNKISYSLKLPKGHQGYTSAVAANKSRARKSLAPSEDNSLYEQKTPGRVSNSYSENLVTFLKAEEGFREKPYKNHGDRPTIGYGTTFYPRNGKLVPVTMKDPPVTQETGDKLLRDFLNTSVMPNINNYFKNVPISQNQIDALISVAYNRGNSGLLNSELFTIASRNPNDPRIRNLFLSDNLATVAGKVEPGLKARRRREWELYSNNGKVDLKKGQTLSEQNLRVWNYLVGLRINK